MGNRCHKQISGQDSYLGHLEVLQLLLPREDGFQPADPNVDVSHQHGLAYPPDKDAQCGAQVLEEVFDQARVLVVI